MQWLKFAYKNSVVVGWFSELFSSSFFGSLKLYLSFKLCNCICELMFDILSFNESQYITPNK